jgi:peptidyl-dipeptidase Dcp
MIVFVKHPTKININIIFAENICIMKKIFTILIIAAIFIACNNQQKTENQAMNNPLLSEWTAPFGVPPFDKTTEEHYFPAFKAAMQEHQDEINKIIENSEAPDFKNTIEALDFSGEKLTLVSNMFYNLTSANTNDNLQAIAMELSPLISAHQDAISMNAKLFEKVKTVYEQKNNLQLTPEQSMLLEKTYKSFVRNGANLSVADKEKMSKINQELSMLSLNFGDHVLGETNKFLLVVENEPDLAGLPESLKNGAAETAKSKGHDGKWAFTIHIPSLLPFLTYAENRALREQMFKAYITKGDHNDSLDNKEIVKKMAQLRLERAQLLGYATHAHYVLEEQMAKTPQNVYKLLDQVWEKALPVARTEASELQKMLQKEVPGAKLEPWDWWFYAEKLRKEKYDLDEEQLRPYFKMENVRDGMFSVANNLFGLSFVRRTDIPVFHPEVETYEVKDADGSVIGLFFMDFFLRESKRGGAWMTSFRDQSYKNGAKVLPIISLTTNFTKPTADMPSLLTFDEVKTMFHEFGHSLHGLLSECTYNRLSGTSVARDFVELPSQIMENWAAEPEVMRLFARHYKTNEVIPDELIAKLEKSGHFNQGFTTVEYMAACYLDMNYHAQTEVDKIQNMDVNQFETESMAKIKLIPEIVVRYRSSYFSHIFAGGYSSGYYSYMWSEVLDADGFAAFKEKGLFDKATAESFRKNVLAKGGTEDPMKLYVDFRGREPDVKAMLTRKGLL